MPAMTAASRSIRPMPVRYAVIVPAAFVFLWSTGFVGARLVAPHAEPLTLLAIRFALAAGIAAVVVAWRRPALPSRRLVGHVAVVGLTLHGVYLGGVFWSVAEGMPTGVAALIAGLQPIITACLVGALLGERVTGGQWLGFGAGLAGIGMVLWERLVIGGVGALAIALAFVALAGVTTGTLYQKRFCTGVGIWPGAVAQYSAAAVLMAIGSAAVEDQQITWNAEVLGGLAWMVLVLSIGAISLLMIVIRRSTAASTVSLLYLAPPLAAIEAFLIFDEELHALAIAGIVVAGAGVFLVQRPART
jgi:drug/metabolite transporter (DMT)-like permease